MEFIHKTIPVGDSFMHYVECGAGTPIILVHGLTNNWEGHIPLARALSGKHKVIIPDLPGYGDSGSLPSYTVGIMAEYVHKFIVALGNKPVTVVGLSMGGYIVSELERKFPESIESAVVMGPVLSDANWKVHVLKEFMKTVDKTTLTKRALKKLVETRLMAYAAAKFINMYTFDRALIDQYGMVGKKKMTIDAYVDMSISIADYNLATTLKSVTRPTILVYGRQDKVSGSDYAKENVLDQNALLSMISIDQAGHVVSFEKPEKTASIIDAFIASSKTRVNVT